MIINGKYIRLRTIEVQDADITLRWRSYERAKHLNKGAETVQEQESWIKSRPENEVNFIIELKDGNPLGMISLVDIDHANKRAESARFLIGEEEKCQGVPVAAEAMLLLYEHAFSSLKLNKVYGYILNTNKMMIKWQKFLGMKLEGVWREHFWVDNKPIDASLMGILASEFYENALEKFNLLIKMNNKGEK